MTTPGSRIGARAVCSRMVDRPLRIVGIGGTTRPGSSTEQALGLALAAAAEAGARTPLFGGDRMLAIPHYAGEPLVSGSDAAALAAAVRAAYGLLPPSPGSHRSSPGLDTTAHDNPPTTARV